MDGRRKALIVANDDYEHDGLQRLLSPAADAQALARVLGDPQICDFDVHVISNEPAHAIQAQVEDLCLDSRVDDVLLLHFSCHGLKSESGELFFAARNTRPNRLASTAVPADFVQRCMRGSRSRCIVLFLDCCYGGAFGQGVTVRASGDINVLDSFSGEKLGGGRGRAVITASNSMEYAFEGDQLADDRRQPSVFTTALVDGLTTGEADRDEDGWVSLNELYDYVFDKVREQTPHQTPSRNVEMQGELYLARSRRQRIQALPIPADLRAAMADPNMITRLGVVSELRSRLMSDDLPAAAGARDALEELVRTNIGYVAEPAASALREAALQTAEKELHFGQVTRSSRPPHQTIHLVGPPLARTCTFQASHSWIHINETTEGLEVSVETSQLGALRGNITVKGPTGETVIPVHMEVTPDPEQSRRRIQSLINLRTPTPNRQGRQRTAIDFAVGSLRSIWPLRSARSRRETEGRNAIETQVRRPIGLSASWGLVIIGVILFLDGLLLTTIPSLSNLGVFLVLIGLIVLVVGTVAVVKAVRKRRGARGQNLSRTQVGGHIGPPDRWSLGRLTRQQVALATSVGLGITSLIAVLVVVTTRFSGTIPVDAGPWKLAVDSDGRRAFVTNSASNELSVIDTLSKTVTATIPVASPWGVSVVPDGRRAYVTNGDANNLSVIDTDSKVVTATIPVGDHPEGIVVTPDGHRAYVANNVSNNVSVIDTASNVVSATIPVGAGPIGMSVTPDGRRVYVANNGRDNVSVIDTTSNKIIATIPVGYGPQELAVTPDGGRVYVANWGNSVSVIDAGSNTVTATISLSLGTAPGGVAVTPDGLHAYVTGFQSNSVSVIDTKSNTVTATIPVEAGPSEVVVTPDGRLAYVVNSGANSVSVIELDNGDPVPAGLERFYRQDVTWGDCSPFATTPADKNTYGAPGLQCTSLEVPLDYTHPNDRTVKIGLLRSPASDQTQRIGSLVINPGGPGASGMSSVATLANEVAHNDLGRRFDLVGFDPRGIGSSKPQILCLSSAERDAERLMNLGVDTSPEGVARTESQEKDYNTKCASRTGIDVLANVGTRDVVSDMDIMRSALGDKKLTYLGYSYGSLVGASYAERFPGNVRAMIFDGAVDPALDSISNLLNQVRALQQGFDDFVGWCGGRVDCALGQDKSQAVKVFHDLVLPLIDHPVSVSDGRKLSYTDATTGVMQALYSSDSWPNLNHGIQELAEGHGDTLMYLADASYGRSADGTYSTSMDAYQAVTCVDNPPIKDPKVVRDVNTQYTTSAPFLDTGRPPSPALDNCAFWPVPPTSGPHHPQITGLPPVIVISRTHDPITPYQDGVNFARELNGRLLTVDGTGHTGFLQGIGGCVDDAGIAYLADLKLPSEGSHCKLAG